MIRFIYSKIKFEIKLIDFPQNNLRLMERKNSSSEYLNKYALTAYCSSLETIYKELRSNLNEGLSEAEATQRMEKHGKNEIRPKQLKSILETIKEQFQDKLVIILLISAAISLVIAILDKDKSGISAYVEPLVIMMILIANATIGVLQERKAELAIIALAKLQPLYAHVIRSGKSSKIKSELLVPGDIVEVKAGDKIPADLRIIEIKSNVLQVEESSLTGEARTVFKISEIQEIKEKAVTHDKHNMLFSSTLIEVGSAKGIVVATGEYTAIGKINLEVREAEKEEKPTPLQEKMDEFSEQLAKIILVICIIVYLVNIPNFFATIHGGFFRGAVYYFKVSVSLAVAAIPEGLPIVIGTSLALGARLLADKNAIIRDLSSVETLGCTTVICSDKTGTLTTNKMTVSKICLLNELNLVNSYEVKGIGLDTIAEIVGLNWGKEYLIFQEISRVCSLCSDTKMYYDSSEKRNAFVGSATEAALLVLSEKIGRYDPNYKYLDEKNPSQYFSKHSKENELILKLEFLRERKSMSALVKYLNIPPSNPKSILLTKGAAEVVLSRCSQVMISNGKVVEKTPEIEGVIKKELEICSSSALRCLGFSIKTNNLEKELIDAEVNSKEILSQQNKFIQFESGSIFLGFAGMIDKPRPGVREAIQECKSAGIKVIMVTGDNIETAIAISKEIGIIESNEDTSQKAFEGSKFDSLSEEDKQSVIKNGAKVFARVEPRHKREIVRILGLQGEITGMTGDGVNDAPALKQANIGIAMGISGTEVAKESSKMILADDNFVTIVSAIEEGRAIFANIKAFIRYLISTNIGEVVCVFAISLVGLPDCISSIQLLWINLVSDGLPAIALGFNPPESGLMKRAPRSSKGNIVTLSVLIRYILIGSYVAIATLGILLYWYLYADTGDGHTLVTLNQVANWSDCPTWPNFTAKNFGKYRFINPCEYFTIGKEKPATLVLTVLIVSEMIVALNSLSDIDSLLIVPPWKNMSLCYGVLSSIILHTIILKVPFLNEIFSVCDLTLYEWALVLLFSLPILLLEELMKVIRRRLIKSKAKMKLD